MITTANKSKLLFTLIGGQFYLDWILITNPTSKNKLIRYLYGGMKKFYSAFDYRNRLKNKE